MPTKICIYGAGAIGCHIAGHLARTGRAVVSVIDHEKSVSAIQKNGIRVITPTEDFTTRVIASTDPATLGIQDYVIVTLKIHQAVNLATEIAHLVGPHTTVIPPSTGIPYYFFHDLPGPYDNARLTEVDPDERQLRALPPSQVLPLVFWCAAHRLGPGVTQQDGEAGRYPLGELDGSDSERCRLLADLMEAGGLSAPVSKNIRGEIWIKFASSVCGNPIAVLTLSDMAGFAATPGVWKVFETMLKEVDAIANVLGITVPMPISDRMAYVLSTGSHKFSMLQDLESGRPLEMEAFAQSLAAVKRISGCDTPTCDIVLSLVKSRDTNYQKSLSGT